MNKRFQMKSTTSLIPYPLLRLGPLGEIVQIGEAEGYFVAWFDRNLIPGRHFALGPRRYLCRDGHRENHQGAYDRSGKIHEVTKIAEKKGYPDYVAESPVL